MKDRQILNIGLVAVLLNTMAFGGVEHSSGCAGGACFAPLANSKPSKSMRIKYGAGCVEGVCFVPLSNVKPLKSIEEKKEFEGIEFLEDNLDDSSSDEFLPIIVESEEITEQPLSDTTEVRNEEKLMDVLWVENPTEVTEDKILEKSDYFCEKDKQVVYLNDDVYECV